MNQPIEKKWKEEFNDRFDIGPIFLKSGGVRISAKYGPEEIISFIENLLEQERQRMSDEIQEIRMDKIGMRDEKSDAHYLYKLAPQHVNGLIDGLELSLSIINK